MSVPGEPDLYYEIQHDNRTTEKNSNCWKGRIGAKEGALDEDKASFVR